MKRLSNFAILTCIISGFGFFSAHAQHGFNPPLAITGSYVQDFETPIVEDWRQSALDDMNWTKNSGGTPSSGTGPSSDSPLDNGSKYMYMEASGNSNKEAIFTSPAFNLTALNNPYVEFYCHMEGSDMGTLHLEYSTNGGLLWQQLRTVNGDQGSSWNRKSTFISWIPNLHNIKFRFRGITGPSFRSDIAIDYFRIVGSSSKMAPTALDASRVEVKAVPNPFSEQLEIQVKGDEMVSIRLYDLQGKLVLPAIESRQTGSIFLPTADIPAGVYMLQIQGENFLENKRVVRQ